MANEIRKSPFLVPPPTKVGTGGGTATDAPKERASPAPSREVVPDASTDAKVTPTAPGVNARLIIEKDEVNGGFIYKSIDRETGEVLQQYPREQVLREVAKAKASEGQIVDTKA